MPNAAGRQETARPALVLLHAFPFPPAMCQPQVDGLPDRWRVLTPELRAGPTMDAMADAVAAHLDGLGLTHIVLGGLSMGGYAAFAFLRRHPGRARALILAGTRAGADTVEVRDRRTRQQADVAANGTAGVIDAMAAALPGEYTRTHRPGVVEHLRRLMAEIPPDRVIGYLEAMKQRPDSTADLASITVPTLVVVGEEDTVAPPGVARDLAERLPDARLATIPRAGHLASLEDPDAFNAELRTFLQGVDQP